jgi:hypothetical protein
MDKKKKKGRRRKKGGGGGGGRGLLELLELLYSKKYQ